MVKKKDLGMGFHYIDEKLIVNLNKNFFKDIYEDSNMELAVDGYLILEKNIEESLQEETLEKLSSLYKRIGIRFIEKIKTGKFNLVINDKKKKKIFFVNDYFGTLPFYYTKRKPFTASSNILNLSFTEIDWYAISQYLKYGYFLWDETQDKYIRAMPPHSIIEYNKKDGKLKIYDYTPKNTVISRDVEKLFKQACNRLYCDEIDYFLGLSGGIDSRFVLYHWPNKKELVVFTNYTDISGEEGIKDVELAKELTKNVDVKKHIVLKKEIVNDKKDLIEYLRKVNPFDIRKLPAKNEKITRFNIQLTGDMAPVISGEFLYLRNLRRFYLTVLAGIQFKEVSKKDLDKAITRIPKNAVEKYLNEEIRGNIEEIPISQDKINIEDYHVFSRTRRRQRFKRSRENDILYPFLDYDLYFSCKHLKNRVNNKLYYSLVQKMPPEYKIRVTRYSFPLSYPRRLQFLSMIIKDVKWHINPGSYHIEEIGGVIKSKPSIWEYMTKEINESKICKDLEDLNQKISGGKHGYFFFLIFIISYWLNNKKKIFMKKN